jgi:hypothetical protein
MKNQTPDARLARRLHGAGILIHAEEKPDGLLIRQYGGCCESAAIAYRGVATLVVLYLAITVDRPRFAISGFDIELPWEGGVQWLEDPRETDERSPDYRFGMEGIPEFNRGQVLNSFADVRRMISRGRTLQGCLLAIKDQPMPDAFQHGTTIPAVVIVSDQFFREYRRPVSLWADRTQAPVRKDSGEPASENRMKGRSKLAPAVVNGVPVHG